MRGEGRPQLGRTRAAVTPPCPPPSHQTCWLLLPLPRLPWARSEQKRTIIILTAWRKNGSHFSDEAFNILITSNYDTAGDGTI